MKRLLVVLIILLFLSSCTVGAKTTSPKQEQSKQAEEHTPKESKNDTKETNEGEGVERSSQAISNETKLKSAFNHTAEKKKPTYKIDAASWSVVPLDKSNKNKAVLITIDDVPDQYALEMAKTLKNLDVPAIFFVNGILLNGDKKAKTLKSIYDMGFMIGNHTYSHPDLTSLTKEKQKAEMDKVTSRIKEVTGEEPVFFRAPFGKNTDYSRQRAKEQGMALMNWSYGYDWNKEYENKQALTRIMTHSPYLHNGAILLMHDREWTNAALKDIVLGLKKQGYEMVDPHDIETPKNQR